MKALWVELAELFVGKTLGFVYSPCVFALISIFYMFGPLVDCDFTPEKQSTGLVSPFLAYPALNVTFLCSIFARQVYDGGWLEGQRSGTGSLRLPGGDIFEGLWLKDKKEGPGERQERLALGHQARLQKCTSGGSNVVERRGVVEVAAGGAAVDIT